jgi:sugar/nucleoside kinase (ribokinase family)
LDVDVFGLGNALVDALVLLDDDAPLLQRHGLWRGTMHLVDDARWHAVFSEVREHATEIHAGGSCANAVSTVSLLGGSGTFAGMVGDDALGATYERRLSEVLGVHHLRVRRGAPTGKCLSLVSRKDAERTMLTDLGTAMDLQPGELAPELPGRAGIFHLTGYLFTGGRMPETARMALDAAREAGVRISFDVADGFVVKGFRPVVDEIIENYASVVFMNEQEARLLGDGDPMRALHRIGGRVDTVVLKLGRRGSIVKNGEGIVPVEAVRVHAVDSTGAGDAYAGGFLFGLARGWDPGRCGRLASAAAALTVAQVGGVLRDAERLRRLAAAFETEAAAPPPPELQVLLGGGEA